MDIRSPRLRLFAQEYRAMKAAILSDRGVVKVLGEPARGFLNGLVTCDMAQVAPGQARFGALLTPQGKIVVDFLVTEAAAEDGGGFFLDCPRALAGMLTDRLNFYKLRAKVMVEDLSAMLGVMAIWEGPRETEHALCYPDPRLPELGLRAILPSEGAAEAAADLGATLVAAQAYEQHRIVLGVPRGGSDFIYGDTFPHEADMDQLGGVDFDKGCYVGQEVVSRVQHRSSARTRVIPVVFELTPMPGLPVIAGEKEVGMLGSAVTGHGLALLRLDRAADALAAGIPLVAGGIQISPVKPHWATFAWPPETRA
jgi:tRNA-modifying protein YgfZ